LETIGLAAVVAAESSLPHVPAKWIRFADKDMRQQ
jgi:hypothetical protein